MSETPRYRCAAERGFLPQPTTIAFAKLDMREGVGTRAEQGDEFDYEGDPSKWMEPINEAARERVEAFVRSGRRKTVSAETAAPIETLKAPPRSGMTRAITDPSAFNIIKDVRNDERPKQAERAAPRRRAKAN